MDRGRVYYYQGVAICLLVLLVGAFFGFLGVQEAYAGDVFAKALVALMVCFGCGYSALSLFVRFLKWLAKPQRKE